MSAWLDVFIAVVLISVFHVIFRTLNDKTVLSRAIFVAQPIQTRNYLVRTHGGFSTLCEASIRPSRLPSLIVSMNRMVKTTRHVRLASVLVETSGLTRRRSKENDRLTSSHILTNSTLPDGVGQMNF